MSRKDEFSMSGAARHYKQSGKRLLPRCAYAASMGMTVRESKRHAAAEIAAMGGPEERESRQVRLPARALNQINSALNAGGMEAAIKVSGARRSWLRHLRCLEREWGIQACIEADQRLLRNCY